MFPDRKMRFLACINGWFSLDLFSIVSLHVPGTGCRYSERSCQSILQFVEHRKPAKLESVERWIFQGHSYSIQLEPTAGDAGPLNQYFNVVNRPVIPYYQNPYLDLNGVVEYESGMGDIQLASLLSPNKAEGTGGRFPTPNGPKGQKNTTAKIGHGFGS